PSLTRSVGAEALFLIALGLVKKVIISDQLAINLVDRVFQRPDAFSALEVLAGVYGYAVQIYCDFSGYTDIAIGSALLLGVRFPKNFDAPYQAADLADFWRRWHISLSTWLRDYLYIPLGGSRGSAWKTYRNLLVTMLLGGLWHGASWTFVFWGFLHGIALAGHKFWSGRHKPSSGWLSLSTRWAATYVFVCFTWVFFRAQSFSLATAIIRKILSPGSGGIVWLYSPLFLVLPLVVLGHWVGALAARQALTPASKPKRIVPPQWATRIYSNNHEHFALKPHKSAGIYVLLPLP